MTDASFITIGTDKQIAYARDIFAKRGAFIRKQRAEIVAGMDQARSRVGQKSPYGTFTEEMADRAEALSIALRGGAEAHAVYWIEDISTDALNAFVFKGIVSDKLARMGVAVAA